MAGAAAELDVRQIIQMNTQIEDRLRALAEDAKGELLDTIGESLESQAGERFETKQGPDGASWQEWSASYRPRAARAGGSLLMRGGDLRGSITHEAQGDEVVVGSNLIYAAVHQYGFKKRRIPARPYLGIGNQDLEDLRVEVEAFVAQALA